MTPNLRRVGTAAAVLAFAVWSPRAAMAQCISLTTPGSAYLQTFDSLANTGTSSAVPAGWAFTETGTNANTTYTAGTGSGNAGDTYSFGAAGSTDRAFGTLLSGSLAPVVGACFTNNTGSTITALAIAYTGEEWRLGTAARTDQLAFEYSLTATSLATGTWTGVAALNFTTPDISGTAGARDGNSAAERTPMASTVGSLNIASGATFWIRWRDTDASGADDGLAVDDFSLTPSAGPPPTTNPSATGSASPNPVTVGAQAALSAAVTPGANPASTNLAVNCDLTAIGGANPFNLPSPAFSATYLIPPATVPQLYSLPCSVADSEGRSGTFTIGLTVASSSTPPSGSASANPNSVLPGASSQLTVTVTPGSNPISTGLTVSVDLSSIGGSASQTFFDDGQNGGDLVAGDHIFSFNATVAGNTSPASKSLPVTIADLQARTGSASIALTVKAPPAPTTIKISQVYGGGGNSGATYINDFFEIFNQSTSPVDISGWSIQQTSATGTTWNVTRLCAVSATCILAPGHYYLVQLAAGAAGTTSLPTADITGIVNLGATSGKVALVANATALPSVACPTGNGIVDFVGYGGSGTTCSETTPAAAPANTSAVVRKGNGCVDTDNNADDFVIVGPIPRNSSAPVNICGGNPSQPSGVGIAVPGALEATALTLLTVTVTPAVTPPSTGISVTGNLTAIGGPASQPFFDDGTHGDLVAGDNVFSFSAAAPISTGVYYIPASIGDQQGRTAPAPIAFTVSSPTCGVERWAVKVGSDPDAGLVNLANPIRTTISALRSIPAPVLNSNPPYDPRMSPTETTVWVVNGTMTFYKLEDDVDYHIVVQDAAGNTIVTEIPSPACDGSSSPFAPGIAVARAKLNNRLNPTSIFQNANLPVQIKGVGFFDFIHGQTGVAPNGIELHPILDINFTTPTATTLQTSLNPSQYGQPLTITATVSSGAGVPAGNLTLLDGAAVVGTGVLDQAGRSSFALSTLTAGTHQLTASYDGDSASAPSVSAALAQVVNKADQTIDFPTLGTKTFGDPDFTVSATASSSLAVSFSASGSCTVAGTGVSLTAAGSCTITAAQTGSANYNPAPSVAHSFTINKAPQPVVTVSAPAGAAFGQAGLSATASGGSGTGEYRFSAGTSSACTVDATTGAIAIVTGTGSCSIIASRLGDANYNDSAPSSPAIVAIHKASTTTAAESARNPSTFGDAVNFTATVSSTTATGTVQFQIDGSNFGPPVPVANGSAAGLSTTTLTAGAHNVTAAYSGDNQFAGSTGVLIQTVNQASTAVVLVSNLNPSTYGQAVTFAATVTGVGGVPTGTVTFKDGAAIVGTLPLNALGQAALTTNPLLAGGHSLTAVYGGDANFLAGASAPLVQTIVQANTTTVLVSELNPASLGDAVTFAAAVTARAPGSGIPTGTITFRDGAAVLATVPLNGLGQAGLTATTLSLGPHAITATYNGDANFAGSASPALSELVFATAAPGGSFVIGDLDAVIGKQVTFWSSQWDKLNHLSGGAAPSNFNGFAAAVNGTAWTSDPANSAAPPASVPSFMAVIAAGTVSQSGSTLAGNVSRIVIVKSDPGYENNGGHPGTGTVVAILSR